VVSQYDDHQGDLADGGQIRRGILTPSRRTALAVVKTPWTQAGHASRAAAMLIQSRSKRIGAPAVNVCDVVETSNMGRSLPYTEAHVSQPRCRHTARSLNYGAQPQLRRAASSTASSQLGRWNNVWRAIRGFPLSRHASCAKGVYPLSQFLWYTRYQ
jgi:hypothetical protein